jgi:hypothetical protein
LAFSWSSAFSKVENTQKSDDPVSKSTLRTSKSETECKRERGYALWRITDKDIG